MRLRAGQVIGYKIYFLLFQNKFYGFCLVNVA